MNHKSVFASMLIAALLIIGLANTASAYYDPVQGRFISRDPIGSEAQRSQGGPTLRNHVTYLRVGAGGNVVREGRVIQRDAVRPSSSIVVNGISRDQAFFNNLYAYSDNNPTLYVDPDGFGYFALRPLEGIPWIPGGSHNPLDDWMNTEISHEQIFFEDGKTPGNAGFFSDSTVREDKPVLIPNYRKIRDGYNDCALRIAVVKTPTQPYSLLGWGAHKFNCQDWAEAVRKKYTELLKDAAIVQKCCVKDSEKK